MMCQVVLVAWPCMIAVGMGDKRPLHGLPGINVKIALFAIDTFVCKADHRPVCNHNNLNMDLFDKTNFKPQDDLYAFQNSILKDGAMEGANEGDKKNLNRLLLFL